MKLQRQINKKVKDKTYSKWVLVLPPKTVEEVGWKEGTELSISIRRTEVILKPKT